MDIMLNSFFAHPTPKHLPAVEKPPSAIARAPVPSCADRTKCSTRNILFKFPLFRRHADAFLAHPPCWAGVSPLRINFHFPRPHRTCAPHAPTHPPTARRAPLRRSALRHQAAFRFQRSSRFLAGAFTPRRGAPSAAPPLTLGAPAQTL